MLELLKNYVMDTMLAILIILIAVCVYYKVRLAKTESTLVKTQVVVERITEVMEAYKKLGDAQDSRAKEAAAASAQSAKETAVKVLKTLNTPEHDASREWALKQISALEGK